MKRLLLILLAFLMPLKAAEPSWGTNARIAIVGDSITDGAGYSHYLMAYLLLRHPTLNLHIYSMGRGGTNVDSWLADSTHTDSNYQYFPKHIGPLQPDYAFLKFGYNGNQTDDQFQTNYESLLTNNVLPISCVPIILGPQPQSNSTGGTTIASRAARGVLVATNATPDYAYSDNFNSLLSIYTNPENWTAIQYPGTQSTPATHHGRAGHAMDAYTCIQNLGYGNDVSTAVLTAAAGQTSVSNCTIGSLVTNAYDGIDFTRLDARLPWAIDEDGGRTRTESERMLPAMAGWQQYLLTVTGLNSGTYDVYINGSIVASVTHTTLAAGWNMSTLTTGPVWTKCQSVLTAIRNKQGIDPSSLELVTPAVGMKKWKDSSHTQYHTNGLRDAALIAALSTTQTALDAFDTALWAAATPATLTFSLRRQGAGAPVAPNTRQAKLRRASLHGAN